MLATPSKAALRLANQGTTLVIGSGITVRGWYGLVGDGTYLIVNEGTISADVANVNGGTIIVNAQPFVNQGLLQSPEGTLNLSGTIASGGLGNVQSGNGVVGLSGFLTNDKQILTLAGTNNPLTLLGGTIHGGTIVATNGNSLIVSGGGGKLDGVTVVGTVDVGDSVNGAVLDVTNGLILEGTMLVGNPSNFDVVMET